MERYIQSIYMRLGEMCEQNTEQNTRINVLQRNMCYALREGCLEVYQFDAKFVILPTSLETVITDCDVFLSRFLFIPLLTWTPNEHLNLEALELRLTTI